MTAHNPDSILPHPDVALLRCVRAKSGYRHVYRVHPGSKRWVAKVRLNGVLFGIRGSASDLPQQAALHAILWYQSRYGTDWRSFVGGRMRRKPATHVWHSKRHGGWLARVWEFGRPVEVTGVRVSPSLVDYAGNLWPLSPGMMREWKAGAPPSSRFDTLANCRLRGRDWKRPGRLLVFESKESAESAVARWIAERWGEKAADAVWRS